MGVLVSKEADGMFTRSFGLLVVLSLFLSAIVAAFPMGIELELFEDVVDEGGVVDGEITLNITDPFDPGQLLVASLRSFDAQRLLTDIFASEGITYALSQGTFSVMNPADSATLVFPRGGVQYVFFQLPKNSIVQDVDMNIHGLAHNGSYPQFPSIDVGLDGDVEWSYVGNLMGYGSFVLPSDLQEQEQGGSAGLSDREVYYCEKISLPRARDFMVSVKHKRVVSGGNVSAVILSVNQAGSTVQGQGGADSCDLPEGGSGFGYTSCEVHVPYFIEGERLICVYNAWATPSGAPSPTFAEVQMDAGVPATGGKAYVCGALNQNGVTTCAVNDKDFFIKVQAGNYSGYLQQQVPFEEGLTEFDIVDALSDSLQTCSGQQCIIPLKMTSQSAGVLYVDTLRVRYGTSAGGSFTYGLFYEGSSSGGLVNKVNNKDLTQMDAVVTLPLYVLSVRAPAVNNTVNATLKVGVHGGPSANMTVMIMNLLAQQQNLGDVLRAYKNVLSSVATVHPALLTVLGYKDDVDKGIADVNSFLTQYLALNGSTQSQAAKDAIIFNLTTKTNALIDDLPRSFAIRKTVTDLIVPGVSDLTDEVVLSNQRDQESKDKLAVFQGQVTVEGKAEYYILEFFDGGEERGTLVSKKVTSGAANAYVVDVLPGVRVDTVKFSDQPEVVQQSGPGIVRWLRTSGGTFEYQYALQGDKASSLKDFKTLVIPQVVPDLTRPITPQVSYTCGDGVCAFLETDAGTIPLEDALTCPQDCRREYPLTSWIVALLVILAIIWYLNFYHGKFNYEELTGKLHLKKKPLVSSKPLFGGFFAPKEQVERKLFISSADERNVIGYVENALRKGFSKSKISDALLAKGWTREQVEYAFEKAKK